MTCGPDWRVTLILLLRRWKTDSFSVTVSIGTLYIIYHKKFPFYLLKENINRSFLGNVKRF